MIKSGAPNKQPAKSDPESDFSPLENYHSKSKGITRSRMFGSSGLKFNGKVFAMMVKGNLVVKLSKVEVEKLVSEGIGQYFDPGHGKLMKEWVSIGPQFKKSWLEFSKQSKGFVS